MNSTPLNAYERKLFNKIKDKSNYGLKENTFKNYIENMRKLADVNNLKSLSFLKNTDNIINKINDLSPSTQRKYYSIILTLLTRNINNNNKKIINIYSKKNEELKKELGDISNKKTNTQNEKWTDMSELKNITKQLILKLTDNDNYETAFKMMLMGLYTTIPPRRARDYNPMFIINDENEVNDNNINYLVLNQNKFIFNNYKTSKTYGEYEYNFNDNEIFKRILNLYLKYRLELNDNYKDLLINPYTNEPLNRNNGITVQLQRITKQYIDKSISVNMIRNIYLTEKHAENNKQLTQTTKDMGTSNNCANKIYIKTD